MANFYKNVLQWATERNIIKGAKAKRQRTKTWEELSELATGMAKSDLDAERMLAIKDAIGDCAVTTANVAGCMGLDPVRIGQHAAEIVQARQDVFKTMDNDDLLNAFIMHQSIVKTGHEDNSHAFMPFVIQYDEQLAISLACLEILATRLNLTFAECQDYAWNQIKDRKGMIVNGTFIKEENGEVEKSLNILVNNAVDAALNAHASKFRDDFVGTLDAVWSAVRDEVAQAVGDRLNIGRSAAGTNAETGTMTFTLVIDAFKQITVSTARTVAELREDYVDSE